MYEPRNYRREIKDDDLVSFTATVKETDLYIRALTDLKSEALKAIDVCRRPLERYIQQHPVFLHSLEPLQVEEDAASIVKMMAEAGWVAGVGPMAAVAGAMAGMVGAELLRFSPEIIVENGGDIFLKTGKNRIIGIYAAGSPFTGKLGLEIRPEMTPAGICTSSGTVGHSLSLGSADAAIIVSRSVALADAAATAVGNMIKSEEDIQTGLVRGSSIAGVSGIIIIKGERMGVWGDISLVTL